MENKILTLLKGTMQKDVKSRGCGLCQSACQSACKTSCTVSNQQCLHEKE